MVSMDRIMGARAAFATQGRSENPNQTALIRKVQMPQLRTSRIQLDEVGNICVGLDHEVQSVEPAQLQPGGDQLSSPRHLLVLHAANDRSFQRTSGSRSIKCRFHAVTKFRGALSSCHAFSDSSKEPEIRTPWPADMPSTLSSGSSHFRMPSPEIFRAGNNSSHWHGDIQILRQIEKPAATHCVGIAVRRTQRSDSRIG
jgi:hypothetical protein